jgi:hypothetical protein
MLCKNKGRCFVLCRPVLGLLDLPGCPVGWIGALFNGMSERRSDGGGVQKAL